MCACITPRLPLTDVQPQAAIRPRACLNSAVLAILPAGKYELIGVLTHKGRSADSGHYVSWVKQVGACFKLLAGCDWTAKLRKPPLCASHGGASWIQ